MTRIVSIAVAVWRCAKPLLFVPGTTFTSDGLVGGVLDLACTWAVLLVVLFFVVVMPYELVVAGVVGH